MDLCADLDDYRNGKAHSFMVESGKYLANKHVELLKDLYESAGKSKVKLTLVGHLLGAGAAAFMALELQEMLDIDIQVTGFGPHSILSEELAEETSSYMTSVIADSDVVPRLNGVTLANMLLDVMEYDYLASTRRDVQHALAELQERKAAIFSDEVIGAINELIDPLLQSNIEKTTKKKKSERLDPVLFPPGKCIHFYRDGRGVSGNYVPNTFFNSIDLTRHMVGDHLLFGYEQIFLEAMRYHRNNLYYSFDELDVNVPAENEADALFHNS